MWVHESVRLVPHLPTIGLDTLPILVNWSDADGEHCRSLGEHRGVHLVGERRFAQVVHVLHAVVGRHGGVDHLRVVFRILLHERHAFVRHFAHEHLGVPTSESHVAAPLRRYRVGALDPEVEVDADVQQPHVGGRRMNALNAGILDLDDVVVGDHEVVMQRFRF